jgi:hypothetical protein
VLTGLIKDRERGFSTGTQQAGIQRGVRPAAVQQFSQARGSACGIGAGLHQFIERIADLIENLGRVKRIHRVLLLDWSGADQGWTVGDGNSVFTSRGGP